MDYVDLKVGGQLIQRTEVYPFQFRYTPPASAVGSVVTLTAEAVDSAGNKSTRDLLVNVVSGDAPPASPVPVGPPTLLGTPTVGSQLSCVNGGFLNAPTSLSYAWLRNGAVIAGATSPTYTLTARRPRPLGRLPDHGDQRPRLGRRDVGGAGRLQPGAGLHGDAAAVHGRRPDDDHDDDHDQVGRRHLQGDLQAAPPARRRSPAP